MKDRLLSIDVLRGMTIFFMIVVNTPGTWTYVYAPLKHAPWDGLTPTDLVFPFFVFIVGLSMSFSFRKYQRGDRSQWLIKVFKRTVLIVVIGLLLNYFPFFNKTLENLRFYGVLQRIGLAYGFGALLVIFIRKKWLPLVLVVLLFGYWGLLHWFGEEGPLTLEGNAVRALDLFLVGENHIYHGYGVPFDPEGLLSTLPAIGTVLFGYLMGTLIQSHSDHMTKIKSIIPYGTLALILGVLWHYLGFPINKPIWSSSYVLVTGGMATLFFCLLLWIIDVIGRKKWTYVFRAFGLNPLASYVLSGLVIKTAFLVKIGDQNIYNWLYTNLFQSLFGNYLGSFIQALTYTMFIWLFAWWLFRKKIIIKI